MLECSLPGLDWRVRGGGGDVGCELCVLVFGKRMARVQIKGCREAEQLVTRVVADTQVCLLYTS